MRACVHACVLVHVCVCVSIGPDICGPATKKVHVILGYKGENKLIKKDIRCKVMIWYLVFVCLQLHVLVETGIVFLSFVHVSATLIHACTHTRTHTHSCTCTHMHMHAHAHARTHTHTHNTHTQDDEFTHLYTFILRSDNTYEVKIDNKKVEGGSVEEDWDLLVPKTISDPDAKKPEDWDDRPKIDDPEDSKPEVCVH